jgi:predicted ATP-grasp superfamily ATP-dependent carboligase
MSSKRILIIGGTTRAAADSVRRAGWQPVCADLFADLDLRANAETVRVRQYPDSLAEDVSHVKADGWFYCGALENSPDIIEELMTRSSSLGPLLGCLPHALKRVRSPFWLVNCLRWEGFTMLDVATQSSPPPADGTWLQKPLAGAGGRLIRVWDESAAATPFSEPHYFQSRAGGIALSAIFRFESGCAEWLGASRELAAPDNSHPPTAFSYCGSCGPLVMTRETTRSDGVTDGGSISDHRIPEHAINTLTRMARVLSKQTPGLNGLVGFDFRFDGDNVWVTEINPRYTASVEILEFGLKRSFLNPDLNTELNCHPPTSDSRFVVKQVVYATRPLIAPDLSRWVSVGDPWRIPEIADITMGGMPVEAGWPICTLLAAGPTVQEAQTQIDQRLALLSRQFDQA